MRTPPSILLGTGGVEERSKRGEAYGSSIGTISKKFSVFHYKQSGESIERHTTSGETPKEASGFSVFEPIGCSAAMLAGGCDFLPDNLRFFLTACAEVMYI